MTMKLSTFALSAVAAAAIAVSAIALPTVAAEMAVTVGGAPMYPSKNIIQNAVNSKDHTTLVAAVKAAGRYGRHAAQAGEQESARRCAHLSRGARALYRQGHHGDDQEGRRQDHAQ